MKSIATKFMAPVAILVFLCMAGAMYQEYSSRREAMIDLIDRQASLALAFDLAIRSYVAKEIRPAMEERCAPDEFFPETMSTSFVARSIFDEVRQEFPDYIIKFSSDDPRNPANLAGEDELRMIRYFNEHPEAETWGGEINLDGRPHLARFGARRMKQSCLRCHGRPEDAPKSMLQTYGAAAGFHRPIGEIVALDTVAIPLDKPQAAFMASMRNQAAFVAAGLTLLVILIAYAFRVVVTRRLSSLRTHFEWIASQSDACALQSVKVQGNDEISALSRSFNAMIDKVRDAHDTLEERVADQTDGLRQANHNLQCEIAERIQVEERLRLHGEVLSAAANAIVITDSDGHIIWVNPAFTRLTGYTAAEAIGKTPRVLRSGEHDSAFYQDLWTTVLAGDVWRGELVNRRKDGALYHEDMTITPVKQTHGTITHFIAIKQDVSERKRTEKALAESERKFMDIFYASADATLLIDDEKFVDCNQKAVDMLGAANKEEVLAAHPSDLSPETQPDGRSSFEKANEMIAAAFDRGSHRFEWDHRRLNGEVYPVEVTLMPVPLFGKQVLYCVWKDITALKEAQVTLRRTQQQLVEASRQAGMSEVATDVLHNVGNVLNTVNVSVGLLGEKIRSSRSQGLARATALMSDHADDLGTFLTDDERGRQLPGYLSKLAQHLADEQTDILNEMTCMTESIDHIKTIVGMQQSLAGVSGAVEDLDLRDLLDDLLRLERDSIVRHEIQVEREYDAIPSVAVDRHRLTQILVNLLRNATDALVEFAQADRRIILRLKLSGEDHVRIELEDNGAGIPMENLTRIFAHGFTTKKTGHGFGLHGSALTAKEMGGSLTVNSEGPGQGATFILELPLKLTEESDVYSASC